jgi:hypothetical protein
MNKAQIKKKLAAAFQTHLNVSSQAAAGLVPAAVTDGNLYQAYVLSQVVEKLATEERFSLVLVGGSKIALKSAPGPINRSYPHIELQRNGTRLAELWTDVEFLSLSYSQTGMSLTKGDYHELDIMIVDANAANRPPHTAIWLGIECKNTSYQKGFRSSQRHSLGDVASGVGLRFRYDFHIFSSSAGSAENTRSQLLCEGLPDPVCACPSVCYATHQILRVPVGWSEQCTGIAPENAW